MFSAGFFYWGEGVEKRGYVGGAFYGGICHGERNFP